MISVNGAAKSTKLQNAAGPPFLFEDVIEYSIEILARGLRQPVFGH